MTDETIFAAALDHPDPSGRAAYLASACANPDQRKRVEALLAASQQAGSFLETPAGAPPDSAVTVARELPPAPSSPADGPTRTHGPDPLSDEDDALAFLAPPHRADSIGRIGHYEVLEVLGRGGFGIVFRAFDDVLQRVVAVKVLAPQMARTSPARKRFIREAQSAAKVKHENVVQVYAVEESPLPFLVMEFVPGETLQQRLDRTGPLDVPEVLRLGRQIAEGLAAAHAQGLIHRDIKPSNILIERDAQGRAKITDFGLARAADDASLTQSGAVAGTPLYMSPEQARGENLDARTDLFSLGSVLYAILTGRPPFRAASTPAVLKRVCEETPRPIREVIPEVPEWLCRVVEKLHAKDPADRYQTAHEVADRLADCERQLQVHGASAPVARPRPSRRRLVGLAAALAIIPLAAWGVYALTRPGPQPVAQGEPPGVPPAVVPPAVVPPPGVPPAVVPPVIPPADAGWVQLFNGKDLTGWAVGPAPGMTWTVQDGVLVGRDDPAGPPLSDVPLLSAGGAYADFHLKLDGKVVRGHGELVVRQGSVAPGAAYSGYMVYLDPRKGEFHTGAMYTAANFQAQTVPQKEEVTKYGEWFTLEVIAQGNHFQTFVNGKRVLEFTDTEKRYASGFIRLSGIGRGTELHVRKIEIKDLRSESPAPGLAVAPFDAVKAKELQDAWARHLGVKPEMKNSIGMELRLIPPGTVTIGSDDKVRKFEEGPAHKLTVKAPFYIGAHEVTRGQYEDVMKPAKRSAKELLDLPVTLVTWHDAKEFCKLLSEREEEKTAGRTYRLAANGEWEYACRAGTETEYFFGPIEKIDEYAWFADNSAGKPHPVGKKKPNAWGLYDTIGNVGELCEDSFDLYKAGAAEHDPTKRIFGAGASRALRGSNYQTAAKFARVAYRSATDPKFKSDMIGFRVVVIVEGKK